MLWIHPGHHVHVHMMPPRRSTDTLRYIALLSAVTVLVLLAIASSSGSSTASELKPSLFSHLGGKRIGGALLIDETAGTVGNIGFGLTVAEAKRRLPARYLWPYQPGGYDLIYCARPTNTTCYGSALYLSAVESDPAVTPRINEIYLAAGLDPSGSGRIVQGSDAVTKKGIRLGSSLARVKRSYRIAFVGPVCNTTPPGATYYARAGANLIAFAVHRNVVRWIVLLLGQKLRC